MTCRAESCSGFPVDMNGKFPQAWLRSGSQSSNAGRPRRYMRPGGNMQGRGELSRNSQSSCSPVHAQRGSAISCKPTNLEDARVHQCSDLSSVLHEIFDHCAMCASTTRYSSSQCFVRPGKMQSRVEIGLGTSEGIPHRILGRGLGRICHSFDGYHEQSATFCH